jgi:hypothetical protein
MIFAACASCPLVKLFEKKRLVARCPLLGEQRKTFAQLEFFRFGPQPDMYSDVEPTIVQAIT